MKLSLKLDEVIILLVGCLLMGISINMFLNPHNIAPGGLTGVSIIINTLTGIPIWLINICFDIPLFLFAFRILGKKDATKTFFGIIFLTLSLKLTENLSYVHVTDDVLLSAISGGIILGLALGLIFRINGSTGGTDLIALMLNRIIPSIPVSKCLSMIDGTVVVLAGVVNMNFETGLYSAIALYIMVKIIDTITAGFDYAKAFFIITEKKDDVYEVLGKGFKSIDAV